MRFKTIKEITGALLALLFAVSCGEDGTIQLPEINVDTKTVTIPAEGGYGESPVNLDIPMAWSVEIGASWVNVTPSSGAAGKFRLEFYAEPNNTGATRECKATISGSGLLSVAISIIQPAMEVKPDPSISLSASSMNAVAAGGEFTITVTSNVPWTARAAADWISLSNNSGDAGSTTVVVTVAENKAYDARSASVTFVAESASATFTVNQEAAQKPAEPDDLGIGGGVNDWGEGGEVGFEQ